MNKISEFRKFKDLFLKITIHELCSIIYASVVMRKAHKFIY